jgi:hypothetical protein
VCSLSVVQPRGWSSASGVLGSHHCCVACVLHLALLCDVVGGFLPPPPHTHMSSCTMDVHVVPQCLIKNPNMQGPGEPRGSYLARARPRLFPLGERKIARASDSVVPYPHVLTLLSRVWPLFGSTLRFHLAVLSVVGMFVTPGGDHQVSKVLHFWNVFFPLPLCSAACVYAVYVQIKATIFVGSLG